jgi:hypothetical protein
MTVAMFVDSWMGVEVALSAGTGVFVGLAGAGVFVGSIVGMKE